MYETVLLLLYRRWFGCKGAIKYVRTSVLCTWYVIFPWLRSSEQYIFPSRKIYYNLYGGAAACGGGAVCLFVCLMVLLHVYMVYTASTYSLRSIYVRGCYIFYEYR